jgi:uncharacterized protein YggE
MARIEIGVVTQAPTAQAASAQNATQLKSVLDQLKNVLGPKADIRTTGYSLSPNYQYPRAGGQAVLTGYTARNTVQVTTEDLAGLGRLIDLAAQTGANNIQQLQFTVKDEGPTRAQALAEAAKQARASAEAMAAALGLKLGKVISVEQGTPQVIRPMMQMARVAAESTPIQEGNIQVHASVTLTIALE